MQKSFLKNTFRTIAGSVGRYIALICIVMLGVIFYVGLKITTTDMIDTANDYYNGQNFYDFCLVSTVGFNTDDIFELRREGQLFRAEGAYYQDMIVSDDTDTGYVSRIHSITDNVNILRVTEGRLPETADECVVDGRYYDSSYIGKKITVSEENSEEALQNIVYKELTITGIADSPLYLSYQRGTTGIGNGSIHSYIFVNYECFGIDFFSQIYIDVENGYYIYGEKYDGLIADRRTEMEALAEKYAQKRYDELSEALADAKKQYSDASEEYNNAYEQYEEAVSQLDELISVNEERKSQLNALEAQYAAASKQKQNYLDNGNTAAAGALEIQLSSIEEARLSLSAMTEAAEEQIGLMRSELDETKEKLDESLAELEENEYILEESLGALNTYALTRDDNVGYSTYEDNAGIVASIAYIFPIFFVLVASLVCITTMSRMVEEERTQIGVFKALGYSKAKIYGKYIFYSLSAAFIGAVLGFHIGSYLFPTVIWKAYTVMYTYTDTLNLIHDYSLFALSVLVSAAVLVGSTVFTCQRVLGEMPAEMIRPKAPAPGKRVFLEKIKFIWNRLPFLHKVSFRNCFRYKKRFFMMLIGIAGCTSLLIIGFGIQDSISSVCDNQFDRIETYDYQISAGEDLTEEQISALKSNIEGITDGCVHISMSSADVEYKDIKKEISLITCSQLEELDGFINLEGDNGRAAAGNSNECVISRNLADSLKVSEGETVTIYFGNLKNRSYTVSGIYENYVKNYVFLTNSGYEAGAQEEPYMNCFLADSDGNSDVYEKLTELSELENVSAVSATQVSRDYFNDVIKSLDAIVFLVIICAAVLAFVVLYNLNNINIMERVREIATIKVLGFFRNETSQYVFRENVILTLLGTLCGLPLGWLMHRAVMSKIKVDMICFDVHVDLSSYLISAGLTILFSVLVEFFMRRKISEINMSESLKSIE